MASGTITGTTSNQYIIAKIVWSSTANTSTNSSTVSAKLYYKRTNTGYTTYGTGEFYVSIDGTGTTITKTVTIGEDWVLVMSVNKTVTHKDDGTKSITIYSGGSISGTTLTSTDCEADVTLDTIPRASTITSASNVTLGNPCSIKWTPAAKSFRFKIKFTLGSFSYTTAAIHPNTTSAYTYTGYTVPLTVANHITSASKGTMTATLYTYSNSAATTQVGSTSSKTFTVTVPNNTSTKPTLTMTLSPVSSLGSPFSSLYLQGLSKVDANFSATGKYNATISSYSMSVLSKSYGSPYTSAYLSQSGTLTVTGKCTDSRGFTQTKTSTITVIPYAKPSVIPYSGETAIVCRRCTSDGTFSSSGTYLRIKAGRKFSTVTSGGTQNNYCLLQYRYKTESATSFSAWKTLLAKTATGNYADVTLSGIVSSATTSYVVQIQAVDDVGETSSLLEFAIPTDQVTFHLREGGKGVGIGKYAENDESFEVADDWDVTGRVYSLGKGKANIPSGADLNNYKEFGVYNVTSNTIAASLSNCPYEKAGVLIVSSGTGDGKNSGTWAYIVQKYISFDGKLEFYRLVFTGATADEWTYGKWECKGNRFWASLGLSSEVSASSSNCGRYVNGGCYYRVTNENHVYVAFNCAFSYSGTVVVVNANAIPEGFRPARNVYTMCATGGRAVARVLVTDEGYVMIDWIQVLSSADATTSSTVNWIDGYIDYWV